jgi:flavin-dependent dehydrogenase
VAGVVIVGAGIGGLATALLLGREGRDVVVCERDAEEPLEPCRGDWVAPATAQPGAFVHDWSDSSRRASLLFDGSNYARECGQ